MVKDNPLHRQISCKLNTKYETVLTTPRPRGFQDLPCEIRVQIYHHYFENTCFTVTFDYWQNRKLNLASVKKGLGKWTTTGYTAALLMTCRLCYVEARPFFFKTARYDAAHSDVPKMIQSMSDFSRVNVRFVSGFDERIGGKRSWNEVLDCLPQLETCEVRTKSIIWKDRMFACDWNERGLLIHLAIARIYGLHAFESLRHRKIRPQSTVIFRMRVTIEGEKANARRFQIWNPHGSPQYYINLNKMIGYLDWPGSPPDEGMFKEVGC